MSTPPLNVAKPLVDVAPPTTSAATPAPSAVATASAVAERAPTTTTPTSTAPTASGTGTWAVVVGIDDYPGPDDLGAAVADADAMALVLRLRGVPAAHQRVLRNTAASAPAVAGTLDWLVANAGPSSTAVVFFAAHARPTTDGHTALMTADGGYLLDTQLATHLRPLEAASTWITAATCHAMGFDELAGPRRVLTAASRSDELAYENASLGHSYLTEYLVQRQLAVKDESVQDAFLAADAALAVDHPDRRGVMVDAAHPVLVGTFPAV